VRAAKWTAITLAGLLVLLAVAVFVITSIVDPNRYRGRVEAIVTDLAGRPLVIDGDLRITWYPWLGVRVGPAHFAGDPSIAQWQSLSIAAKTWPLLRGEIVVDRVRLQSLHVRLRRDAQGHGNWEGLGPRATKGREDRRASSGAEGGPSGVNAGEFAKAQLAGIEIRDGTVEYVDEVNGVRASASNLELDMGEWQAGQPLTIHTRFLIRSDAVAPGGVWIQADTRELTIQLEPLKVATPKMSLHVAEAQLTGDVVYERAADDRTAARGSATVHVPSVRKLADALALNQTLPHDPAALGQLDLTSSWSYSDGVLAAKPLSLELDGIKLAGWVERQEGPGAAAASGPRAPSPAAAWTFELHGDRIDLGRYLEFDSTRKKPFELPVDALRAINANGTLTFDEAQLADTHMADLRLRFETPEAKQ
jgi:AsmA protein